MCVITCCLLGFCCCPNQAIKTQQQNTAEQQLVRDSKQKQENRQTATGFFYVAPIHKCLCVFPAPNPRFFFVFPLRLIGLQSAQANNNMVSVIIKSHTDARTHARTAGGGLAGTEEEEVQWLGQGGVLKAVPVSE